MTEELGSTTVLEPTQEEPRRRSPRRKRTRAPEIGSSLGRYLVVEHIGRGAMGYVLRAYDPKLQREVAIKLVSNSLLDTSTRDRMLREARAMAQLSHPNVVAVYDAEESDSGVMLVMEYVPGRTLRDWTAKDARGWADVVSHFVAAGRGLAAAHATGLLHRDFKADNVLVANAGQVKVTDFGLAKLATATDTRLTGESVDQSRDSMEESSHSGVYSGASSGAALDSALTQAGTVMGTPRYMAPEQHRGDPLGPAADQYAFCVALWEALVGKPPFRSTTLLDLAAEKQRGAPSWPSSAPRIPRVILEAMRRGLSPDAGARWPSMEILLEELRYDPSRRRNRWLLAIGGVGALGLGLGGWQAWVERRAARCSGAEQQLAGIWDEARRSEVRDAMLGVGASYATAAWGRTEAALDRYTSKWVQMHTQACEATTIRGEQSTEVMDLRMACLYHGQEELDAVVEVLAHADAEVTENADDMVDGLMSLDRCADVDALRAEVEPPSEAEADAVRDIRRRLAEAKAQREAGRYAAALDTVALAELRLAEIHYEPVAAEVALERGRVLELLARYPEAERALRRALESASRWHRLELIQEIATELMAVVGADQWRMAEGLQFRELAVGLAAGDPEAEATARRELAAVLSGRGDFEQAEAEDRRALELYEQALGPEHLEVATTRSALAIVLDQAGKAEESLREQQLALELIERARGPEHPDTAQARNNLALSLHSAGRYEEAETELRRALELHERVLGPEHIQVANTRNNLGLILDREGRLAEAEAEHRKALALREKLLGPEHPDVAQSWNNLALALYSAGRYEEAVAEEQRALALQEKTLGPEHPDVVQSIANLGLMLEAQGKSAEAEKELRRALAVQERVLGPEHPRVALSHNNLGLVLYSQGKSEEAEKEMRRGLELHEKQLGEEHPMVALSYNNIAQLLHERKDFEGAVREHRRALALYVKTMGEENPDVARSHNNLAMSLAELGQDVEAESEYRLALTIWEKTLGTDHPNVALTRNNLAIFLNRRGRPEEALPLLELAWQRRQREDTLPVNRGSTALLLARVLWKTSRRPADRARARELATRAMEEFGNAGPEYAEDVEIARAWLADPDAPWPPKIKAAAKTE